MRPPRAWARRWSLAGQSKPRAPVAPQGLACGNTRWALLPAGTADPARRLRQKAQQAQASGGGWLRADILDGTWVFTPWARAGLRVKIDEMARQVKPLLAPYPAVHGVVLSNGAGMAQGEFFGESAWSGPGCYGLRRVLPAVRVRETMIVATTETGSQQARSWIDIYGPENSWLDLALSRFQLPAWNEIRP